MQVLVTKVLLKASLLSTVCTVIKTLSKEALRIVQKQTITLLKCKILLTVRVLLDSHNHCFDIRC